MPLLDTLKAGLSRLNPLNWGATGADASFTDGPAPIPGAIGMTGYAISRPTDLGPGMAHVMFPSKRGFSMALDDLPPRATRDDAEVFVFGEALRRARITRLRDLLTPANQTAFADALAIERQNILGGG